MPNYRAYNNQAKWSFDGAVIDVIRVNPDATTPTAAGSNVASIARNGAAGDYTLTFNGVWPELVGIWPAASDNEGIIVNWDNYSAANKTIDMLITDDAGTGIDASDIITFLVIWTSTSVDQFSV